MLKIALRKVYFKFDTFKISNIYLFIVFFALRTNLHGFKRFKNINLKIIRDGNVLME